jgi:hypothetical protein
MLISDQSTCIPSKIVGKYVKRCSLLHLSLTLCVQVRTGYRSSFEIFFVGFCLVDPAILLESPKML